MQQVDRVKDATSNAPSSPGGAQAGLKAGVGGQRPMAVRLESLTYGRDFLVRPSCMLAEVRYI